MKKTGRPLLDMTGKKFNRLTVVSRCYNHNRKFDRPMWNCICECGNKSIVSSPELINGIIMSCGCYIKELAKKIHTTHGYSPQGNRSPEYKVWNSMKARCNQKEINPNSRRYAEKGIKVCQRWLDSFENFLSDMGERPTPFHSIDRINGDGDYEPSNCKWATALEQGRNRENNHWIEDGGVKMIISEFVRKYNLQYGSVHRLVTKGLSIKSIKDRLVKQK